MSRYVEKAWSLCACARAAKWLAVTVLLAAALCLPRAGAQAKVAGVVVRWGEVEGTVTGPMGPEAHLHALSEGQHITNTRFIRQVDTLQAQLCRRFGIEAWLTVGPNDRMPDMVHVVVRHPVLTRPDGAQGDTDSFDSPVMGADAATFFTFDHGWEMQPGPWTFELRLGDELLVSHTITITPPAQPVPPERECQPAVS